ncbi:PAS domain S-box-containing protein [Formivibrio citricus]|uniref:PAS domain S-box-containing protein n=1 Tax=Formivibrio citricus TaxID=83765 RepID=A0A1I4WUK6_9NEIS|nr:sensor histidine kinase [Formivibrio citricus]SFN17494.1 PAS domain S-box-containing protein [Formivibrio citricus]
MRKPVDLKSGILAFSFVLPDMTMVGRSRTIGVRCLVALHLLLCMLGARAEVSWTPPQKQWLASHPEISVGMVLAPPYVQVDSKGGYQGLSLDYLNLLQQDLGVTLKPVVVASEEELERLGLARKIDMALGVEQFPVRLRYWLFSESYLKVANKLVMRSGKNRVESPEALSREVLAVPQNAQVARFLERNYPELKQVPTANAVVSLQKLATDEVQVAVLDRAQALYWLQQPQHATLQVGGDAGFQSLLRVASRDDWPELNEILDQALADLPRDRVMEIEARWIRTDQREWWEHPFFWGALACLSLAIALLFAVMAMKNRRLSDQTQLQLRQLESELLARQKLSMALSHTQFSVDHSPIGILRLHWDGRIQYANQAICADLGLELPVLMTRRFQEIDPAFTDANAEWLAYWNGLRRQHFRNYECELRRNDGSLFPVEVHACHQAYEENEYLVLFMTDISERNRIRRALEESEARFRELANHVPGMVFQLRQPEGAATAELAYLSEAGAALCGYPADYIRSNPAHLQSIVHPMEVAAFRESLTVAIAEGTGWNWAGRIVTDRSEVKWVDLKASLRVEADGTRIWDGMAWDITANKRIEQSLGESRLLLRELAAHHEAVREREKASIAREVHDELGQVLTAMKIETSVCEMALGEGQPALAQRLAGLKKLIDRTLQISRNVVTALRPPALDLGLLPALEWLTQRLQERLELQCVLEIDPDVQDIDEARGVILFRIVQEALTNVARHARANWVLIRIRHEDSGLSLLVEDNGCGFDTESISRTFGLVGIRERVWMLRGTLEIDSAPGAGTRIIVKIPHAGESQ